MARRRFQKLGEATIHSHSGNFLFYAEIFMALLAEGALAAGPVNPGDASPVANLQITNRGAFLNDPTGNLVTEDQRSLCDRGELRPIPIGKVQVRVADAASLDLDENLVRVEFRPRNLFEHERLFEFVQDCGLHAHLSVYHKQSAEKFRGPSDFRVGTRLKPALREAGSFSFTLAAYGCAPSRKKATALRTRSVKLCGPERSTAHRRTTVV
jgi:hypothetical protein